MTTHHCAGSWIIIKRCVNATVMTPRFRHTQKKNYRKHLLSLLSWLDSPNNYSRLFGRSWKSTRWNVAAPAFPGEEPRHFLAPQPPIPLERKRKFTPTDGSGGEKKLRERVEGRKKRERVGRQAAARKARCKESDREDGRETIAHLEATLC